MQLPRPSGILNANNELDIQNICVLRTRGSMGVLLRSSASEAQEFRACPTPF